MASVVDICNLALARLGDDATIVSIDPPEGSAQAEHCARFYPVARDALLESHPWQFAVRRTVLAPLTLPTWNWRYVYAAPNNALQLLGVLPTTAASDDETEPFETESDDSGAVLIRTDQAGATLRYTARVTDPSKFSPLFVDALGWLLASHLAGPLIKGTDGAKMASQCYANFRTVFSQAVVSNANQRHMEPDHTPDWMSAR